MSYIKIINSAYLNHINIPKLSGDNREYCDSDLSFDEVTKAVKSLANNKTPGPDGLPTEFYKVFWSYIGQLDYLFFKAISSDLKMENFPPVKERYN